jgi:DNA repair ATPase RecN
MLKPVMAIGGVVLALATLHLVETTRHDRSVRRWEQARDSLRGVAVQFDAARRREAEARIQALRIADSLRVEAVGAAHRVAAVERHLPALESLARQLRDSLRQVTNPLDSIPQLVRLVTVQDSTLTTMRRAMTALHTSWQLETQRRIQFEHLVAEGDSSRVRDSLEASQWRRLAQSAPVRRSTKLFGLLPRPQCGVGVVLGVSTPLAPRPGVACVFPF